MELRKCLVAARSALRGSNMLQVRTSTLYIEALQFGLLQHVATQVSNDDRNSNCFFLRAEIYEHDVSSLQGTSILEERLLNSLNLISSTDRFLPIPD